MAFSQRRDRSGRLHGSDGKWHTDGTSEDCAGLEERFLSRAKQEDSCTL